MHVNASTATGSLQPSVRETRALLPMSAPGSFVPSLQPLQDQCLPVTHSKDS
jgi:hypothetical protein